jgi:hypothetical protein
VSVYASPTSELAKKLGPPNGLVYQIKFEGKVRLAQLTPHEDSKYHQEVKGLRRMLFDLLGQGWVASSLAAKTAAGRLWMPCLHQEEVEEIMESVPELKANKTCLINSNNYWKDISLIAPREKLPSASGEIFFEPINGYHLKKITGNSRLEWPLLKPDSVA